MIIIAGAGGHALEILDILLVSYPDKKGIYLYDDLNLDKDYLDGYPILHSLEELKNKKIRKFLFCLGIGNPMLRKKMFEKFKSIGGNFHPVCSKSACVSPSVTSFSFDAMALSFISRNVHIGLGTLINTGANVHHGVEIGEFTMVSPRATILGDVKIGSFCEIGANATILPKIKIGDRVTIGAGAVVTGECKEGGIYIGIPAKNILNG